MTLLRITALVENTASKRGQLAEHGLAFWIELGDKKILFDTGQGNVLEHNAGLFGIRLQDADAIVLSHGHYDHTGGVAKTLRLAGKARVFAHPDAFSCKYSRHADGSVHEIGMPSREKIRASKRLDLGGAPREILPGLSLTGFIPRNTDFEDLGGMFFQDMAGIAPDPLNDDQAAFVTTPAGTVVISGCAHSGLINTLRHVSSLTGGLPVHTVIGGAHLVGASENRMSRTVAELKKFPLSQILPAHCTGFDALCVLRREFPETCRPCNVGTVVEMKF